VRHVFVETNWVVAYSAPAHQQAPAAAKLIDDARAGQLRLYLPALCLTEARHPLRTKYQPRTTADSLRRYLGWATREGRVNDDSARTVRVVLDQYEALVSAELD
jgi:predicted nucleic acid-binding protein